MQATHLPRMISRFVRWGATSDHTSRSRVVIPVVVSVKLPTAKSMCQPGAALTAQARVDLSARPPFTLDALHATGE